MTLEAVTARLKGEPLDIFGALHTVPEDGLGDGTVVLLGPREPGFWTTFTASPEWQDGAPDPMDRWSTRVINAAARCGRGAHAKAPPRQCGRHRRETACCWPLR